MSDDGMDQRGFLLHASFFSELVGEHRMILVAVLDPLVRCTRRDPVERSSCPHE